MDNLQGDCSRQQETNDDKFAIERCKEKNRKSSQTTTASIAIFDKSDKQEQEQPGSSNNDQTNNNNQESASQIVSNRETEEKSSCDEGLGTGSSGNSSAQSSSAGSHCDDRETPPHVVVVVGGGDRGEETSHLDQAALSPQPALPMSNKISINQIHRNQPIHCSNSCDNLKLSLDSLNNSGTISGSNLSGKNLTKQQQQSKNSKTNKQQRNRSFTLSDDEAEKVANRSIKNQKHDKSRKMRALTWSASLTSFGASFKFGSKGGSKTNEPSQAKVENSNDSEENDNSKTILFHTDCFSCSTCNELLVDLRALIYVSEQAPLIKHQDTINPCSLNNNKHDSVDYVNLAGQELMNNEWKQSCDDYLEDFKQQIGLYCHRHFVELFKPRCQQCDCLILDEECTEAEGKFIKIIFNSVVFFNLFLSVYCKYFPNIYQRITIKNS